MKEPENNLTHTLQVTLTLLIMVMVSCLDVNAISFPMTKNTKALYEKILNAYPWGMPREVADINIKSFNVAMQEAEQDFVTDSLRLASDQTTHLTIALQALDFNEDKYDDFWDAEKALICQKYKNDISKLNFIQKKYLFANLKEIWQNQFSEYKYKYALLILYQSKQDFQDKLEQSKKRNSEQISKNLKLQKETLKPLQKEGEQLDANIVEIKNSITSTTNDIQKLQEAK